MLLEFRVKNYKVFREEAIFSMKKAPKQSGLKYSILKKKQGRKNVFGLCSSVIYGPNASGKTNLIGAMDTLRSIVLRGNVKNGIHVPCSNPSSQIMGLIPNCHAEKEEPIAFFIQLVHEGKLIEYTLHFTVGTFMSMDSPHKIVKEELSVNQTLIFSRSDKLHWGDFDKIKRYYKKRKASLEEVAGMAEETLSDMELFLTNGLKLLFSPFLVNLITEWFEKQLVVFCSSNKIETTPDIPEIKKDMLCSNDLTSRAAKSFGVYANQIGYVQKDDSLQLCSLFHKGKGNELAAVPADVFESLGTTRFLNLFPIIFSALKKGHTLILDEFDASMHPMAIMSLINVFHNDEINTHGAQLIFNTHNPIFLNNNLFRRDEIKFVERDAETHASTVYSLSDFGTAGDTGVRKGDDYLKNYFINQYGAIENIDFSNLFLDLIEEQEQSEEVD